MNVCFICCRHLKQMHFQSSWFSLQLMQRLLFKDITHFFMWCLSAHFSQRWFFLQILIMWLNSWHLKHCVMRQFFSNSLHAHSWYKFSMLTFISWFIIASIAISTMSNEWVFSLSVIFLSQTILRTFRSSWSFALSFISLSMIFSWLFISIVVCTLCVNIAKIQRATCIELAISFAYVWVFFRFAWASELTAWRKMSSLLSLRSDIIRFLWSVNTSAIFCRICSINFFCISFISLLFIILIMTSHFLRSDDELSLERCFLVAISSLATFAHDVIFIERRVFFCVCNCLLSSWIDVFNFCTFFAMNVFWFAWCFSSESSRRHWISFNAISFHEWSLLFFFSNVDIFISRSIILATFSSLSHECFNLASLFSCNESTSLVIIFESALLQFMQFIVVQSSSRFTLSCL